MAITAKFQADFTSFLEAITKAEAELVDFSEGAARVEKALNRMTDGFSGRKVIQDMILMATALEQVGGASILTTQELQAMGVKADAAIAKMKAIGVEVPPGIQKLSDLSRAAAEETLRLGAAAEKASKQVADEAAAAAKLNQALNQFSGQKVIQEATLMAKAVEQAGGASKLTANELQLAGAKAAEAAEKMKKLGVDVPPGIQNLADRARGAAEDTLRMGAAVKVADTEWSKFVKGFNIEQAISNPVGTAKSGVIALATTIGGLTLAATASVAALVAMGVGLYKIVSAAAEVGGELDDMADKTGLSVPALSRLQNAAQVVGADMNQLTDVIFKLSKGIGDNTDEFQEGLQKMGLSTAQLKAAGPDRYLDLITAGLNSIKDPTDRAAAGAAVLGKGYSAVAASLVDLDEGLRLTADIKPWTTEQAAEAEKFDVQIQSLIVHVKSLGTAFGRDLLPAFNEFLDRLPELALELRGGATSADITDTAIALFSNELDVAKAALDHFLGREIALPPEMEKTGQAAKDAADKLKKLGDAAKDAVTPEQAVQRWKDSAKAVLGFGGAALSTASDSKDLAIAQIRLTAEAEKSMEAHKKSAEAIKQAAAALKPFKDALADVTSHSAKFEAVIETIDGAVLEGIRFYVQRGASLEKLAIIYGLTAGQVKALGEMFKSEKLAEELARFDANLANVAANTDRMGDNLKGLGVDLKGVSAGWISNQNALDVWQLAAAKGADSGDELLKNLRGLGVELPKLEDHSKGVHRLAQEFVALAQIGGDTFDGLSRSIGTFITQLDRMHEQAASGGMLGDLKDLKKEWDDLSKSQKTSLALMAGLEVAASIATGKAKTVLSAASKGAQIGSIAGPWGAAIGAGVGALVGLFKNLEKQVNPVREAFVQMHGGLAKLNAQAQEAGVSLDAMLNAKNPQQYEKAINDLNAAFERQAKHVKDVGDGLKKAASGTNALSASLLGPLQDMQKEFDKAIADAGKSSVSLAKLLLKKKPADDEEAAKFGLDLASQIGQGMRDALGDEAVIGDLNKRMAKAVEDVQPTFEHLGQYVAATFAAQIHEGASAFDAFKALAPSFEALQSGIKDFGLTSTDTIDQLLKIQGVVGANKDVSDSVQALSDIYDGLTQAGYLTKDLFESFAEDISYQFDLLVSRGADGTTALQLMQPELQKLWEGQQKFGEITDESTKALLDQAEKQGLVGEDMKNVNDKILDVLLSIADVFGAKLPKSLQAMVDQTKKAQVEAQKALDAIHAPDITIGVHFNVDPAPDFGDGFEPIRMARGGEGRVTKPTLFLAGEGGPEDVSFRPAGQGSGTTTNETPDWARELIDTLRGLPRTFRDASFGAAV